MAIKFCNLRSSIQFSESQESPYSRNSIFKRTFILLLLIFSFSISNAQTSTKKYNSYLERYEYFNNNGVMIGFEKYNSYLEQWEYTDIGISNSSSSKYEDIPVYEPNYNLINKVLAKKEAQYNSRMDAAEQLIAEVANKLNENYQNNTEIQREAKIMFSKLFGKVLESLEDRNGKVDVYNNEIYRRFKSGLINSYNQTTRAINQRNTTKSVPELSDSQQAINYYNFGVREQDAGNNQNAIRNYKTAIKLNPNLTDAYINMTSLILKEENPIIEEMNGLGMSEKEIKRYDYLQNKRESVYLRAIPILEKVLQLEPNRGELRKTLKNIKLQLGEGEDSTVKVETKNQENSSTLENFLTPDRLGGYSSNKILEFSFNDKGEWVLKKDLDIEAKVYFTKNKYYFKRGDKHWKQANWTYNGLDDKNSNYLFYDNMGQTLIIDKEFRSISWYYNRDEDGIFKNEILYKNLKKDDSVIPE